MEEVDVYSLRGLGIDIGKRLFYITSILPLDDGWTDY